MPGTRSSGHSHSGESRGPTKSSANSLGAAPGAGAGGAAAVADLRPAVGAEVQRSGQHLAPGEAPQAAAIGVEQGRHGARRVGGQPRVAGAAPAVARAEDRVARELAPAAQKGGGARRAHRVAAALGAAQRARSRACRTRRDGGPRWAPSITLPSQRAVLRSRRRGLPSSRIPFSAMRWPKMIGGAAEGVAVALPEQGRAGPARRARGRRRSSRRGRSAAAGRGRATGPPAGRRWPRRCSTRSPSSAAARCRRPPAGRSRGG